MFIPLTESIYRIHLQQMNMDNYGIVNQDE